MARFIIITGLPGAGKTFLAQQISEKYRIPIISKDFIKESLADSFEKEGEEWSKKLGVVSIDLLKKIVLENSKSEGSFILDSCFRREWDDDFFLKLEKSGNSIFQILMKGSAQEIKKRIKDRLNSGSRHWIHRDESILEVISDNMKEGRVFRPLSLKNTIEYNFNSNLDIEKEISKFLNYS